MHEPNWRLVYYVAENHRIPYREWFDSLKDFKARAVIDARFARIRLGNFGKCEPVGCGVYELKIYYGPGYRIYFSKLRNKIILLLCGGEKSSQRQDIQTAKIYWGNYQEKMK